MPNPITITINAQTADAVVQMEKFFSSMTGGFEKLTNATSFLEGIGSKLAAFFTVGAIVSFTEKAIDAEAALDKLSKKTGVAVETLSALRSSAKENGMAFEEVDMGLGLFSDRIFNAVRHGGQAAQVFSDIGIRLLDVQGKLLPTEAILTQVMDRFAKMPDGPQKVAVAMELFGRSGREWITTLSKGADEFKARLESAKQSGKIITSEQAAQAREFTKSMDELETSVMSVFRSLANSLIPALNEFVHWSQSSVSSAKDFVLGNTQLSESFKTLSVAIMAVAVAAGGGKGVAFFSSIFGGVSSISEIGTAIGLIIGQLRTMIALNATAWLTSPVSLFAAALFSVIEVIRAASAAWDMFKAKKEEALSVDRLRDGNLALAKSIAQVVEQRRIDGKLTEEQAERINKMVSSALALNSAGTENFAHARLAGIAQSLVPTAEQKPASDPIPLITDQEAKIQQVKTELESRLNLALNTAAEASLELSYKKRLVTTGEYIQQKRNLEQSDFDSQNDALLKQLDLQDQLATSNPYNPEKLAEIKANREKLLNQIFELAQTHKAQIAKLDEEQFSAEEQAAKQAGEVQVTIAETNGQKLLAAQLKIRQQFKQMRDELATNNSPDKPSSGSIDSAEKSALAQAEVTDQVEKAAEAQRIYLDLVEETKSKIQDGQITESAGQAKINEASKQYIATLTAELIILDGIGAKNPELDHLAEKIADIQKKIADTQRQMNSDGLFANLHRNLNALSNEWSNLGRNAANVATNAIRMGVDGISDAIMGAITHTRTWGQVFQEVGMSILAMIIKMVIQYTIGRALIFAINKIFGLGEQEFNTKMASDAQAAWAPAAISASIASYGAAAGAGLAAYLLAQGTGTAASAGGSAAGGMMAAEGGLITGPGGPTDDRIPANLSNGEFVVPANRVKQFGVGFFEAIRTGALNAQGLYGGMQSGMSYPVTSRDDASTALPGLSSAGGAVDAPNVNVEGHKMTVFMLRDQHELKQAILDNPDAIMHVVKSRGPRELGLRV